MRKRGFTIIELLVVVVTIALLTSMATTSYINAQRNSRDSSRKVKVSTVANAIESYYRVKLRFPGQSGTATPDAAYTAATAGCESYDASTQGFVYSYFPTINNSTITGSTKACNLRNVYSDATNGYTFTPSDYAPYPNWIPGIGEYLNPIPVENRYRDGSGTEAGTFQAGTDPLGSAASLQRTFVYRRLAGGYAVYTTLEGEGDREVVQNPPYTFADKPFFPNGNPVAVKAKNVFIIRK